MECSHWNRHEHTLTPEKRKKNERLEILVIVVLTLRFRRTSSKVYVQQQKERIEDLKGLDEVILIL